MRSQFSPCNELRLKLYQYWYWKQLHLWFGRGSCFLSQYRTLRASSSRQSATDWTSRFASRHPRETEWTPRFAKGYCPPAAFPRTVGSDDTGSKRKATKAFEKPPAKKTQRDSSIYELLMKQQAHFQAQNRTILTGENCCETAFCPALGGVQIPVKTLFWL